MDNLLLFALIGAFAGVSGAVIRIAIERPNMLFFTVLSGAAAGALAAIGAREFIEASPATAAMLAAIIGFRGGAELFSHIEAAIKQRMESIRQKKDR